MSDKAFNFYDSVHEKLGSLEGRMDLLKLNIGTTWHCVQEKPDEVRCVREEAKQSVTEARANMEAWFREKKADEESTVDQSVENLETQKLTARAQRAEDCAGIAIDIAQASIDDAERMLLEAIAARRSAEAATEG